MSSVIVGEESCIGSSACVYGKSYDRAHNVCIQMKMTSTNIYLIFDKGSKKVGDKSCRGDNACLKFVGKSNCITRIVYRTNALSLYAKLCSCSTSSSNRE